MLNADEARKLSEDNLEDIKFKEFKGSEIYKVLSDKIETVSKEGEFSACIELDTFKKQVEYMEFKDNLKEKGYECAILTGNDRILLHVSWYK